MGLVLSTGCASVAVVEAPTAPPVMLPYLRLDTTECYFIDDFLPTPDSLVTGRVGGLFTRYYSYGLATYKEWDAHKVMLSFFSKDNRCWALFEEFAAAP